MNSTFKKLSLTKMLNKKRKNIIPPLKNDASYLFTDKEKTAELRNLGRNDAALRNIFRKEK